MNQTTNNSQNELLSEAETNIPKDLPELERYLQNYSHDDQAIKTIQQFSKNLKKTEARQDVFNQALIREPIYYQDVVKKGLADPEKDSFTLLQGDIVSTNAAYFLGDRLENTKFAIATSTCDLVKNRRQYAALLRVQSISSKDPKAKEVLSQLLQFKSTQRMYLPPFADDSSDIVGNALLFDGIVQIKLDDLLLAQRHASLSLVGWRIFGSMVRSILVRAGEDEVKMRSFI
ncbi:hypothetical protein MEN41_16150 [Dolichospermum sp. ST_con]|jgi:hypothetical protein|nr:hypothetical protein [Dolichospermum sp. ST_con]MDD1419242.1 hypothetical protein [Dolichospermum sp. ST_sed1]MDD1424920.1 hypothetical protein [Dolichospermum sp. ST_sed9]MDD1430044.1 hypothetical protein [Dolichospermum sp. ST_sed6]MDD1437986.1 hypothetical protein [Dolichospermum sp. ST_sed10]MDD1440164.1 hypothetical protein [Dolichospermum sp. ST_sed3]MDD1446164.1 hypothetical protein [Dolichospermum sp. ST_sed8]MDD1456187.1 hypothetical protein [Dolichospermum sp. ST_sed7]MDD146139